MNRIYRLVFNHALGQVQVTSEIGASPHATIGASRRLPARLRLLPLALALAYAAGTQAVELPQNGSASGAAISYGPTGSNTMTITQAQAKALINWGSFNIGEGGAVNITTPGANSVTLNVVSGGPLSTIDGALTSTGHVFLINPAGVAFGGTAQVNVAGLVASSLALSHDDQGGNYEFAQSGAAASVSNAGGVITSTGPVVLMGASVSNGGVITGTKVDLLSAGTVSLHYDPLSGATAVVGAATSNLPGGTAAAVTNSGTILANSIVLQANLDPTLAASAINLGGVVKATGLASADARGGELRVSGDVNAGTIRFTGDGGVSQSAGSLVATTGLELAVTGDATLSSATNQVARIGGVVRGNLALSNAVNLAQTGALEVAGTTTLNNASKDATLTNAGNRFGENVSLDAGNVSISAAGSLALGNVRVDSLNATAGSIHLPAAISSAGGQSYNGAVVLGQNTSLSSTLGTITFGGVIDGGHALAATAGLNVNFAGAVGSSTALTSLDVSGEFGISLQSNVTTTGRQRYGGPVNLAGATSLISQSAGAIDFSSTINGAHGLTVNTAGATTFAGAIGGTTALASLTTDAAGTTRLGGNVRTTGSQTYGDTVSLSGPVTLSSSAAGNIAFGSSVTGPSALIINTAGQTAFGGAVSLGSLTTAAGGGTLLAGSVNAVNDIAFSGPLRLDADLSLTSARGKVSLNGAVDSNGANRALTLSGSTEIALGGPLGATSELKSLRATAGVIELGNDITSSGNIVLDGSVHLTGNARLHSSAGAINSGTITSGVSAGNPDGYDLGLRAQSTLQLNGSIAARTVDIDALLFNGFGVTSKGALRIVTALPLIQGGAYLVGGTATFGSTGDIQLTNPGNRFGGVVSLDGVNARVNADDLQLGNVRLGGALRLELGGSLSQAANTVLDVEGITTLIAGDAITLNGNGNRFGGSVSVSGKQIQIQANDLLAFSSITATSLQATAARLHLPTAVSTLGLQRYDGAVTLLGDTRLASDVGQIFFNGSIDGAHALTIERALEVVFNSTLGGSTALASLDTRGVANTHLGGDISSSGTIALGGLSLLSTRDYRIASSAGDVRIGGAINGTADGQSSLSLRAAGALDLQGDAGTSSGARLNNLTLRGASIAAQALQTRGTLDIGSGSGFAQGGTLTVGGDAVFSAGNGGNLRLANAANSFGGKVALQGNQATLRAQSSLALDSVNLTQLTAYSNGPLSLANATVLGNASLEADALTFDNASIDGALTATARTGNISQGSGALAFGDNSTLNARSDIVLGNANNSFGSGLRASGRDVTLASTGALDIAQLQARDATLAGNGVLLGGTTLDRDLTVDSSAAITQGGSLDVAGDSRFIATGEISLIDSNNRFGVSTAAEGNSIAIISSNGLRLASVRARDGLSLHTGNAGIGQSSGSVQVDGDSQLNSSGTITLQQTGNRFAGRVDINAAAADITSASALRLGRVSTSGDLRVSADAGLRLEDRVSAANIDLVTAGIFDNRAGSQALAPAANGHWHVYLASPSQAHVFGGLDSGNTALWNMAAFVPTTATGNRYLFAYQPTLTVAGANLRKIYGNNLDLSQAYTVSGAPQAVAGAYKTDTVGTLFTGRPNLASGGAGSNAVVSGSPYVISVSPGNLDSSQSDYAFKFVDGTLQVDPRSLTITANNGSKSYGQNGGLNGYHLDGLVNGDTVNSVDLGSAGTSASANAGHYTITASNADGGGLGNYDITYVDGVLSIGKAGLTITANNGGKTYGQNGGLNGYRLDGLLNGDSVNGVEMGSAGATATANVGDYTITASNADGSGLSNYDITYVDGVLSIGKAGLTITANNGGKTYGQNGGLNGFASNGLVNGDTVNSVDLGSAGTSASANVGDYIITASNADGSGLSNYDITYVDGVLSIGKAGLTITANNGGKTYGRSGGLNGFASNGLINGDSVSSVDLVSNGTATTANVGNYIITAANADGSGLSNYDITYVDGVLSIGKAGLTITANNGGKTYGQNGGLNGFSSNGLVNGDSVSSVDLVSNGTAATANVGNYTITAANADGSGLSNYDITYVDGVLSIGKAGLTITANNATKSIGQTIALDGYRMEGLLNRDVVDSVTLSSDGIRQSAAPGEYAIVASNAAGSGLSNYDIRYVDGNLQVEGIQPVLLAEIAAAVVAGQSTTANPAIIATGMSSQHLQLQMPDIFTIEEGGVASDDEASCQALADNGDCPAPE